LLFQVNPFDPFVLIASSAVILMLSIAASAMPAQRAAAVDPMHALRDE
jgi:ABC-type lipoprotein release transport system permease subunit